MVENKQVNKNMLRERKAKSEEITDEIFNTFCEHNKWLYNEYFSSSATLSDKTIKQYRSGLKYFFNYVKNYLHNKNFYEITKRDFLKYINYLISENFSSSGIACKKAVVAALATFAEMVLVDEIPEYKVFRDFSKIKISIPKDQTYEKKPVTQEEYDKMIQHLEDKKDHLGKCWLITAFGVGGRRNEIRQLKTSICNVVPEDGKNHVMSNTVRGKGKGKKGKQLTFIVPLEVVEAIKEWINIRDYESDYIFTTRRNGVIKAISEGYANDLCERLSEVIGRRLTSHAFKGSLITRLLSQNKDLSMVSKWIAHHESPTTTLGFYNYVEKPNDLSALLDGKTEEKKNNQL